MDVSTASTREAHRPGIAGAADLDLDRTRATLMVLGIALHTADVFITSGDWLVADSHRSAFFDALVALIHSFRVPGFFLLSGLLFAGSLRRHATPDLLVRQLLRLGVPLLSCWLLLNGAQQALLAWQRGADPWAALDGLSAPVFHLWFLRDLLVLNLLVLAAWAIAQGRHRRAARTAARGPGRFAAWLARAGVAGPAHWLSVALAGALLGHALILAVRLTGIAYEAGPGDLTLFNLAFYAPLFLAGLALWHRPAWLRAWLSTPLWLLPVAAFAANWGDAASATLPHPLAREAALAVELLGIWIATGAAVGALGRWRTGPRGWLGRMLAEASYTIFLVHHLLVVALALLLLPLDWPAAVKFPLIALATLALSLAIHRWLVRPFALMRLLFNGRTPAPQGERPVTPAPGRARSGA